MCLKAAKVTRAVWHRHTWHSSQIGVKRPGCDLYKRRQSCTKARGRKEIKGLRQNKLTLSDCKIFSFQETRKTLISSKNLSVRIIFLWNKPRFSFLIFLFLPSWDFLIIFFFYHFFSGKIEKVQEETKRENVKQPRRNLDVFGKTVGEILWINEWSASAVCKGLSSYVFCFSHIITSLLHKH